MPPVFSWSNVRKKDVRQILGPLSSPVGAAHCLGKALIAGLCNISHTFFPSSLCQPLSSAGAVLIYRTKDTRTGHTLDDEDFPPKNPQFFLRTRVLKKGTMHNIFKLGGSHSHDPTAR